MTNPDRWFMTKVVAIALVWTAAVIAVTWAWVSVAHRLFGFPWGLVGGAGFWVLIAVALAVRADVVAQRRKQRGGAE